MCSLGTPPTARALLPGPPPSPRKVSACVSESAAAEALAAGGFVDLLIFLGDGVLSRAHLACSCSGTFGYTLGRWGEGRFVGTGMVDEMKWTPSLLVSSPTGL